MRIQQFFFAAILLVCNQLCFSQISENFTDGDYTANPVWTPSAATDFIVNGTGQLQSNNTTANSTFYISTPSTLATTAQWEFYVNLKLATSGTNSVDVYLMASAADLTANTTNGYFVRIGNTADEISLYKKVGATSTIIINGLDGTVSSSSDNKIRIKVVRDASNNFILYRDLTGGTNYTVEGSVVDATQTTSSFFGILIRQSTVATFAQKHFFDDIIAQTYVPDVIAPTITSSTVNSSTTLDVLFNEPLDALSAATVVNYSVNNGIGNPTTAILDGSNSALVHLTFAGSFSDAVVNQLTVNGVKDISGNAISNGTTNFTYFAPYIPQPYDVVIDEIMADESPAVGLPEREWIELKNTTNKAINLTGWKIKDGTGTSGAFPSFTLAPGAFVILCSSTAAPDLATYGTTLSPASFPGLTNSGESLTLINETGTVIHSLNYKDTWYQDATKKDGGWTLEMINTQSPCSGISNWSASVDVKGGTPGAVNSVNSGTIDATGPKLLNAIVVDATHIKLVFDEKLDSLTAATVSNYNITGGLAVQSATTVSPGFDTVNITLNTPATSGQAYTITASGVTDCLGNIISSGTASFTYFAVAIAKQYDVVIDEIMADESPVVGLPENEWIELKNISDSAINLQGWKIKTASSTSSAIPNFILQPDSFVVICKTGYEAGLSAFGTTIPVSTFPSPTNTSGTLTLLNASGTIIHSLSYTSAWYHDATKEDGGWTLEMINTQSPCTGISNWKASVDVKGGTPGAKNSVDGGTADATGPKLLNAIVVDAAHIKLVFDEKLDSLKGATTTNYSINNGMGNPSAATTVSPGFDTVNITLNTPATSGQAYTITATGVTDCLGNIISSGSATFTYFAVAIAKQYDVVIDEIMADESPAIGLPEREWIELKNTSDSAVNLQGWRIKDGSGQSGAFSSYILAPGAFVILCSSTSAAELSVYGATLSPTSFPSLGNAGELLTLVNASGTVIHAVNYSADWYKDDAKVDGGWTLEMINTESPCSGISNWSASVDVKGGTPGAVNSVNGGSSDLTGPKLLRTFVEDPTHIVLYFDESLDGAKAATIANYTITNSINIISGAAVGPLFESVNLILGTPLANGVEYTITAATAITDCLGNNVTINNTAKLFVASPATSFDLVVNEIFFDPIPSINNQPPGVDYVEIYNRSNKVIDLQTIYITNRSSTTGEIGTLRQISPLGRLIQPGEYIVVTENPTIVQRDFIAKDPNAFITLSPMPSLSNDKGYVILCTADTAIIDEIDYSDKWHFRLLDNKEGISLERINYDDTTKDNLATAINEQSLNWHSAATNLGGTPTYKNSQFRIDADVQGEVTTNLEVFSPDNDGQDDELVVNYSFPEPGYVAKFTIFDASGRTVIYSNQILAGREGKIKWDGLGTKGQKLPIGIYIIYTEVFNLKGKKKTFKNPIVLARRN